LRCALERTPFDYLVLMTGGDSNEVLKHPGKYKPRDVFALARALDSEIEDRIRFGSLLLRSENLISEEESFDPKWLAEAHRECDQYLHAQKDPATTVDDSAWVEDLRLFLGKTAEKLLAMWKANQGVPVKLTRSGSELWKLFKSRKYNDEQMIRMMRLAESQTTSRATNWPLARARLVETT